MICGQMKWICVSIPPAVMILPSAESTSVQAPISMPFVTPSIMSGLPALPMPTMRPSRMPISAFTIPHQSMMIAFVITRSSAPFARVADGDWPMPSRMTLPPPNLASSPGTVRSRVISISKSVSARRMRSPAVGPYRSLYCRRGIFMILRLLKTASSCVLASKASVLLNCPSRSGGFACGSRLSSAAALLETVLNSLSPFFSDRCPDLTFSSG